MLGLIAELQKPPEVLYLKVINSKNSYLLAVSQSVNSHQVRHNTRTADVIIIQSRFNHCSNRLLSVGHPTHIPSYCILLFTYNSNTCKPQMLCESYFLLLYEGVGHIDTLRTWLGLTGVISPVCVLPEPNPG